MNTREMLGGFWEKKIKYIKTDTGKKIILKYF